MESNGDACDVLDERDLLISDDSDDDDDDDAGIRLLLFDSMCPLKYFPKKPRTRDIRLLSIASFV
jgi:hypothetical protein